MIKTQKVTLWVRTILQPIKVILWATLKLSQTSEWRRMTFLTSPTMLTKTLKWMTSVPKSRSIEWIATATTQVDRAADHPNNLVATSPCKGKTSHLRRTPSCKLMLSLASTNRMSTWNTSGPSSARKRNQTCTYKAWAWSSSPPAWARPNRTTKTRNPLTRAPAVAWTQTGKKWTGSRSSRTCYRWWSGGFQMALRRRNLSRLANWLHRRTIASIRAITQEIHSIIISTTRTIVWASRIQAIRITARKVTGQKARNRRELEWEWRNISLWPKI